jgi:DNA-directed RNA polymerase specialized sigma24 family protein
LTNEPFDGSTTIIVNKIAAGDRIALEEFVHRYNRKMVRMADRYMRRLRTHLVTCDAEGAVNGTLAKLYRRAIDGELPCVESSIEFWKMFFSMLKDEIRGALDRDAATKRGGPGARRSRDQSRLGGNARAWREWSGLDYLPVDEVYTLLAPSRDLALIRLEIEEFLQHLDDPLTRRIAVLKLQSYTNGQIAELLELNERTIERKLVAIRRRFLEYEAGS